MTFDWSDYLDLASKLASQTELVEAGQRSAISRAYYSLFCVARKKVEARQGKQFQHKKNVHGLVKQHLEESHSIQERELAAGLDRLREDRNKADYDDEIARLKDLVAMRLEEASRLLDIAKEIG